MRGDVLLTDLSPHHNDAQHTVHASPTTHPDVSPTTTRGVSPNTQRRASRCVDLTATSPHHHVCHLTPNHLRPNASPTTRPDASPTMTQSDPTQQRASRRVHVAATSPHHHHDPTTTQPRNPTTTTITTTYTNDNTRGNIFI